MTLADALSAKKSFEADKYGPGLQDVSVSDAMNVYGLGRMGMMAPKMMRMAAPLSEALGEAGAIFPEGMPLPKDRTLIKELGDILPESRKKYLLNQQLSDWHAQNYDWPRVLKDKWAMLSHFGGN